MKTALCDLLGIDVPIVLAPMGVSVGPKLVAAVCNAGVLARSRFGGLTTTWSCSHPRDQVSDESAFRRNLNLAFPREERLDICLKGAGLNAEFVIFDFRVA